MSDQQQEQTVVDDRGSVPAVGDLLRDAREARGESLSDVAHALKLAPRQVEALELERFDLLPGPAFVRGFMRNYARYVGIDIEARIARLTFGEAAQIARLAPVTNATGDMPSSSSARNALKPAMVIIAGMLVLLAAGSYFDWFKVVEGESVNAVSLGEPAPSGGSASSGFAPAPQVPLTMPRLAPDDGETSPLQKDSGSDRATGETTGMVGTEVGGAEVGGAEVGGAEVEGAEVEGAEVEGAEIGGSEVEFGSEVSGLTAPAEGTTTAVIDETPPESGRLVFSLSGESWIQVRDGEGAALYTGTGSAGTTRTVQGKPPFSIVIGNAGLVSLDYDDNPIDLAPHIRSGGVARLTLR